MINDYWLFAAYGNLPQQTLQHYGGYVNQAPDPGYNNTEYTNQPAYPSHQSGGYMNQSVNPADEYLYDDTINILPIQPTREKKMK